MPKLSTQNVINFLKERGFYVEPDFKHKSIDTIIKIFNPFTGQIINKSFREITKDPTFLNNVITFPGEVYNSNINNIMNGNYEEMKFEPIINTKEAKYLKKFLDKTKTDNNFFTINTKDESQLNTFKKYLQIVKDYKLYNNNHIYISSLFVKNNAMEPYSYRAINDINVKNFEGLIDSILGIKYYQKTEDGYDYYAEPEIKNTPFIIVKIGDSKEYNVLFDKLQLHLNKKYGYNLPLPRVKIDDTEPKSMYDLNEGEFFPYVNKSDINLEKYQIFNDPIDADRRGLYNDNCLVYALTQFTLSKEIYDTLPGKYKANFTLNDDVITIDSGYINQVRLSIRTHKTPKSCIKKIMKILNMLIITTSPRTKDSGDRKAGSTRTDRQDVIKSKYGKEIINSYGSLEKTPIIELLLYEQHYMINESVLVNNKQRKLLPTLRKMMTQNLFEPMTKSDKYVKLLSKLGEFEHVPDSIDLNYPKHSIRIPEPKKLSDKQVKYWYADFEAHPIGEHKPYLCILYDSDVTGNELCKYKVFTDNITYSLLNYLNKNTKHEGICWYHNLRYDSSFIINNTNSKGISDIIKSQGKLLQFKIGKITFRDSYALIPERLANFSAMFGLEIVKELYSYKFYSDDHIKQDIFPIEEYLQAIVDERNFTNGNLISDYEINELRKLLISNCERAKCKKGDFMSIMKYSRFYCMKDVQLLKEGLLKFEQNINDIIKSFDATKDMTFKISDYITISSVGYDLCLRCGCLDDVYEYSGTLLNFMKHFVNGGRCMTAHNVKSHIYQDKPFECIIERNGEIKRVKLDEEILKIVDFDAVGLYNSAMHRLKIPQGKPIVLLSDQLTYEFLQKQDYYFVEINVTENVSKYDFPLMFNKSDSGIKNYENNVLGTYYVDKVTLEDLLEFNKVFEFEIVKGIYFNSGFITKINEFIEKLFNARLQAKKSGNQIQLIYKLIINSIYGKSIMKFHDKQTKIKTVGRETDDYISRHYNYLIEANEHGNKTFITEYKSFEEFFDCPVFGCCVLSMSKRIMNEVMCTAELSGIDIFYQDTDSMHLLKQDVDKLREIYNEKYNRELIGTNMGQFHSDFALSGAKNEVFSTELICLGKKSYLDMLSDSNIFGIHSRLKGIPSSVIKNHCNRYGITTRELYMKMYNGESVNFDLLQGSNCFNFDKCMVVSTKDKFNRELKF